MKKVVRFLNRLKYIYLSVCTFLIIGINNIKCSYAGNKIGGTGGNFINSFNDLSDFATKLTNGMLAFSMLSGIAVLLYHIVQLALAGSNPNERSKVFKNLLTSVICLALLGSISLVMALIMFYTGI